MRRSLVCAVALLSSLAVIASACGGGDEAPSPWGGEGGPDGGSADRASPAQDGSGPIPTDDAKPKGEFDAGPAPTGRVEPVFGEITIMQLDLPAGLTARIGESALLVGPDGTTVLIDVGNSAHADEVRSAVKTLNTTSLTAARGFSARGALDVDYVIITHFHGDHVGAFEKLITGSEPLNVKKGVIHRGWVDVGSAVNEADFEFFCTTLSSSLAAKDLGLCTGATKAPCTNFGGNHPATACDGLLRGDLSRTDDDGAKKPSFIDLGAGARLDLLAVNGFVLDGTTPSAVPAFGHEDTNEENARSVAGIVSHGAFRYHFAGDMTGTGQTTEPDVESALVSKSAAVYGALGVDVAHANHHARRTSSNTSFVAKLAPKDGRSRNVVAGINSAYLASPYTEVLTGWADGDRLGAGSFWITGSAIGGASHPKLVNAQGEIIVSTVQKGDGYWIQTVKDRKAQAFPSVRR